MYAASPIGVVREPLIFMVELRQQSYICHRKITRLPMNRLSIRLLCIVALFSVAASCQKELSYEADTSVPPPSGTAVYTLAGAPGNCTAPVISGTFRQRVAAADTNTIAVQVAV